jgi:hypothetical protein
MCQSTVHNKPGSPCKQIKHHPTRFLKLLIWGQNPLSRERHSQKHTFPMAPDGSTVSLCSGFSVGLSGQTSASCCPTMFLFFCCHSVSTKSRNTWTSWNTAKYEVTSPAISWNHFIYWPWKAAVSPFFSASNGNPEDLGLSMLHNYLGPFGFNQDRG